MDEIVVTPALETEAAACFALLPQAAGWPVELLVAKRGHAVVGAAALRWRNASDPPGFPLALHVPPPDRRRGIGRKLLVAAIDLARDDARGLWSHGSVVEGEPGSRFLLATGFAPLRRERHFEASAEALLADVARVAARLRARIPSDVRIVPLAGAHTDAVGRLLTSALGRTAPGMMDRLAQRANAPAKAGDRSRVALRGDVVEGAILWKVSGDLALVEASVVDPRNRGWLNTLLLEDGLVRAKAEGLDRMRFHCEDTARDTLSLAKRCGATEREVRSDYYLSLDG